MVVLIIVIVIVVLLGLGLWAAYNGLVKKRNRTQEAWSEIDVELKRRHDLIPNLVSTVQGYAAHERGHSRRLPRPGPMRSLPVRREIRVRSPPLRMRCRGRCVRCSRSLRTTHSFGRSRASS